MKVWASITAALAVALSLAVVATAADEAGKQQQQAQVGQKAPDFTLQDQTGKQVSLSDYAGKIVVLEWFNNDCPYVVRHYEANTMKSLAEKYADQDVVWLAINTTGGKTNADNQAIAGEWNIGYPILNDSEGKVAKTYAAKTTPHMYIIDKDGTLVYAGGIDNDPNGNMSADQKINYVDKALAEVTQGQSVSTPESRPYGCAVKY